MEKIYLSIIGNPIRREGARLLLNSSAPFSLEYAGLPGIDRSPYAIEIKVQPTYTLYKLYCNNVTTSDGYPGTLVLGMSVPVNHRIAGDKSPLDFILDVLEKFRSEYMFPPMGNLAPGNYTFKATNELIPVDFFQEIFNKYPLEKMPAPHYPMTGSDKCALRLGKEEMRMFTCDVSRYANLTRYAFVVIAENIDVNYYTENLTGQLEIPLKRRFRIAGRPEVYENVNESITVTSAEDELCYNRQVCTFTIAQLLSGNIPTGIIFDYRTDTITCNLRGTEKRVPYHIRFRKNGMLADNAEFYSALSLTLNGRMLPVLNGTFELVGEQNRYLPSVQFNHSRYKLEEKSLSKEDKVLYLDVSEMPQVISPPAPQTRKVQIKLYNAKEKETYWYRVEKSDKTIIEGILKLKTYSGDSKVAEILLPGLGIRENVSLSIHNENKTTEAKNLKYDVTEMMFDAQNMAAFEGAISLYTKICLFLTPVLLFATIFFAYMFLTAEPESDGTKPVRTTSNASNTQEQKESDDDESDDDDRDDNGSGDKAEDKSSKNKQDQKGNNKKNSAADSKKTELTKFLNNAKNKLAQEGLTFDDVKKLYKDFNNKYGKVEITDSEQQNTVAQINAYNEIVKVLTMEVKSAEDKEKLKEDIIALKPDHDYVEALNKTHSKQLLAIYWGDFSDEARPVYWDDNDRTTNQGNRNISNKSGLEIYVKNKKRYKQFNGDREAGGLSGFFNNRVQKTN